jgi:hypothetical protein
VTIVKFCNKQCLTENVLYFERLANGLVQMRLESGCPELVHAMDGRKVDLDPMSELFTTADSVLSGIASHLPHRVYPFLFAALKGLQVEAGLGVPETYTIEVKQE